MRLESTTPRGVAHKDAPTHVATAVQKEDGSTTPRAVTTQQPVQPGVPLSFLKKEDREGQNEAEAQKVNVPSDPNNLNEDSMCFSQKTSLEEYIIGK